MNEDWTGVIFGMGVLILGTVILVVVLVIVGRFVTERAQRNADQRYAELAERYEALAEKVSIGQDAETESLAEIRTRVTEIERMLRDVG